MSSLEITTLIGCPLACTFCPQDSLAQSYGTGNERMLTLDKFKQIITKLPPHVRIDFSGMAEPFVNPQCIRNEGVDSIYVFCRTLTMDRCML